MTLLVILVGELSAQKPIFKFIEESEPVEENKTWLQEALKKSEAKEEKEKEEQKQFIENWHKTFAKGEK